MEEIRWGAISGWAIDFIRAMRERPLWARILFRLTLGRFAYREFIGLMDELDCGFSLYGDYGLEGMEYHQDATPALDWWSKRDPIPLGGSEHGTADN